MYAQFILVWLLWLNEQLLLDREIFFTRLSQALDWKFLGILFVVSAFRTLSGIKLLNVCPTHSEARQTERSESGPEKGLLRGLCKEVGGSCPEKPGTPWKILAKHFSRQGEGGTRQLWQTSFPCVCVCGWVFLPPNFFKIYLCLAEG